MDANLVKGTPARSSVNASESVKSPPPPLAESVSLSKRAEGESPGPPEYVLFLSRL